MKTIIKGFKFEIKGVRCTVQVLRKGEGADVRVSAH